MSTRQKAATAIVAVVLVGLVVGIVVTRRQVTAALAPPAEQ